MKKLVLWYRALKIRFQRFLFPSYPGLFSDKGVFETRGTSGSSDAYSVLWCYREGNRNYIIFWR